MKKIRIKKYNKLNEDNTQQTQQQGSQSKKGLDITYKENDNPNRAKEFEAGIARGYAREIARETNIVQIKVTKSFQQDIQFPTAPTQLASLFLPAQMPKKFYNVYNSYDADPLKTISECEDLAEKYFSDLNTGAVSSNQAAQKNTNQENTEGTEQESEQQNQQPVDSSTGSQNESWNFILNEGYLDAVGTTASAGFTGGFTISKIGGLVGSGLAGLLTGLLPLGAGAYSLGYTAGGHGTEHGKWIVDDHELQQQLSEFTEHPKSLQTYIGSAIDSYVKDLMSLYEQGLRHITTNSKSTEISKLNKMVINLCVSRTPKYVEEFVKENNSMLKDIIKMKAQVAETKFNATNEFLQRVTMMLRDPKFIELGVRPEAISAFLASRGKNAGTFKDDYDKIANYMSSYSRKGAEFDDAGKPFESVKYDMTRVLNEAEEVENKLPQFDADSLYDNIEASIESAVSDILAGNTEDWAIVQTARKQMNAMRDAATKEITTSIEHVCRLANGDQSGLSARLTGFISKHPMRAAKLTNLWARHETDLNARIEQRIKQISEMDGKGPLQMASQLYKRVIPKLLAMMITYKTILNFYTDERLRIPGSIIGNMYPEDKIKEQIKHFKNVYAQELAYAFVLGCNKLTADGTAPFDTTSGFNSKPMPYLVPWLMCLLSDTNDMDPLDIKHMRDIIITLETAAKANDYNVFFSRLSDYVMKECKCKHNDAVAGRIAESWSLFNTIEFKEFIDDVQTDTALQQYAGFEKVAPYATYILMQVIKTKGEVLEAFKQSLPSFNTYKPDDVINDKKKREQIISNLHIDEKDDDDAYARAEKLFNTAMPILMAIPQNGQGDIIIAMRAYYAMQLHKMNNVHNFPLLRLKLFKDMCYHPIIQAVFGTTAATSDYLTTQKHFNEKLTNIQGFMNYVKFLCVDMPDYVDKLDLTNVGVTTENQFASRVVNVMVGLDKAEDIIRFLTPENTKDADWNFQENTMEDISKVCFRGIKHYPKNIGELLKYNEDTVKTIGITNQSSEYIKKLLLMEVMTAIGHIEKLRQPEQDIKDCWDEESIPRGAVKKPLSHICGFIMGLYSQAGDKAKKKIQRIIENFDNGYNQLVYDKYNIPLNSQCRLFTEFMCKDQQMFKDSSDFVGYVENYLMSNSRHVVNDQEVKLLICLHDYILGVNTHPSVEKFYQLESNRARTNNNPTPTE